MAESPRGGRLPRETRFAEVDGLTPFLRTPAIYADRRAAGRELGAALAEERERRPVVVGLARGGVEVAVEVARALDAPLDVVAVRKIGHPLQPEYAIGAVTPGDGAYVRALDGLTRDEVAALVERARAKAAELDARLHAEHPPVELAGRTAVLVDDGLATGATMVAALRFARARGAARTVAAAPVAAAESLELLEGEADAVVCPHPLEAFYAVGVWYREFAQVDDEAVIRLLAENREGLPG